MKRAPLCVAFAVALIQVGVARSSEPKSQAAPQIATPADEVKQMEMLTANELAALSDDAAVLVSHVTLTAKYSGKEASGEYRHTAVWIKGSGGWYLVANQITPIVQ